MYFCVIFNETSGIYQQDMLLVVFSKIEAKFLMKCEFILFILSVADLKYKYCFLAKMAPENTDILDISVT